MNAKKAKALRRMAKEQGYYKLEPDYRGRKVDKMVYVTDPKTGEMTAKKIEKVTVFNLNRVTYRRMKKAYNDGLLGA